MNNFSFSQARNIQEAIQQSDVHEHSAFIAGGTNITDLMKYFVLQPDMLIDINRIDGCRTIEETETGVRLGALVTNADTAYHPLIEERFPLLSKAILAGASAQIRNMATNGGNLLQRTRCYYYYDVATPCNKRVPGSGCSATTGYNRIMAVLGTSEHCIAVFPSDMCVALAALDAVVYMTGPSWERSMAFTAFHRLPGDTPHIDNNLQPNEIITHIDIPANNFHHHYSYLKLRDRNSYAFALVSVATGLELDGDSIREARIALGGVAHKPWRSTAAEEFLKGKTPTKENFAAAADIIMEGAVGYEHNAFKIELAKRAIVRNGLMALQPETQLPGAQPSL
jgi:xanthine dehydrogenase YagS FAD-binding subunit